jgi:hypothetical protein
MRSSGTRVSFKDGVWRGEIAYAAAAAIMAATVTPTANRIDVSWFGIAGRCGRQFGIILSDWLCAASSERVSRAGVAALD